LSLSFASCNKCQECDCSGTVTEYCEKDFDSKDDYNAAISILELVCSCS
jgi:hypothetical protein